MADVIKWYGHGLKELAAKWRQLIKFSDESDTSIMSVNCYNYSK